MKIMKTLKPFLLVTLAVVFVITLTGQAKAGTLIHQFDYNFSGTTPGGTSPWMTATFDDSYGGPNTVRLTMSTANLVSLEFASQVYFNFDPVLDPTGLIFAAVNNSDSVPNSINTGIDSFKADGDGYYDINFDFPPPPGEFAAKFTTGEMVVYDITYTSAISASSFNFLSEPGGGTGVFKSAAHIQGINGGGASDWIGTTTVVPEPISSTLFVAGGVLLGFMSFRKMKKA